MKQMHYKIRSLYINTTNGARRFDSLETEDAAKAVRLLRKYVQNETLTDLYAYYGPSDAYSITVYAEQSSSFVLIYNGITQKSYHYSNPRYADDKTEVELSGYYFPQMCICEDKNILLDIILHYFETGNINEQYEWIELDERN